MSSKVMAFLEGMRTAFNLFPGMNHAQQVELPDSVKNSHAYVFAGKKTGNTLKRTPMEEMFLEDIYSLIEDQKRMMEDQQRAMNRLGLA